MTYMSVGLPMFDCILFVKHIDQNETQMDISNENVPK